MDGKEPLRLHSLKIQKLHLGQSIYIIDNLPCKVGKYMWVFLLLDKFVLGVLTNIKDQWRSHIFTTMCQVKYNIFYIVNDLVVFCFKLN